MHPSHPGLTTPHPHLLVAPKVARSSHVIAQRAYPPLLGLRERFLEFFFLSGFTREEGHRSRKKLSDQERRYFSSSSLYFHTLSSVLFCLKILTKSENSQILRQIISRNHQAVSYPFLAPNIFLDFPSTTPINGLKKKVFSAKSFPGKQVLNNRYSRSLISFLQGLTRQRA